MGAAWRPAPAAQPAPAAALFAVGLPAAAPPQPGLMAQMASRAAGVAVGATVGTLWALPSLVVSVGLVLASESLKQFLECVQNQGDVKLWEEFNEVLRQCRPANGFV